jgi:L-aminopeptidase/D-esterase-like protein
LRIPYHRGESFQLQKNELRNDRMTPLFAAVIEATEEAIYNRQYAIGLSHIAYRQLPAASTVLSDFHELRITP